MEMEMEMEMYTCSRLVFTEKISNFGDGDVYIHVADLCR